MVTFKQPEIKRGLFKKSNKLKLKIALVASFSANLMSQYLDKCIDQLNENLFKLNEITWMELVEKWSGRFSSTLIYLIVLKQTFEKTFNLLAWTVLCYENVLFSKAFSTKHYFGGLKIFYFKNCFLGLKAYFKIFFKIQICWNQWHEMKLGFHSSSRIFLAIMIKYL